MEAASVFGWLVVCFGESALISIPGVPLCNTSVYLGTFSGKFGTNSIGAGTSGPILPAWDSFPMLVCRHSIVLHQGHCGGNDCESDLLHRGTSTPFK